MSFYDVIANIQKELGSGGKKPAGPFNSDGKVNFGTAKDIAKNLPKQPAGFASSWANAVGAADYKLAVGPYATNKTTNDKIEELRLAGLGYAQNVLGTGQGIATLAAAGGTLGLVGGPVGAAGGAIAGAGIGTAMWGIKEADQLTNGNLGKAMMAGTKGIRSNYAFVSDVTKHNAAMGLLSGLGIVAGAVLGAGAIVATGGAAAPAVFAAALGAYGAGRAERYAASHGAFDFINPNIRDSAIYAQSPAGQNKYNFGRDVVKAAAKVTGSKELGDTSRGIGAVISGIINFGVESALTPDIKGVQLGTNLARQAVVGGVQRGTQGVAAGLMGKIINEPARQAERAAAEAKIVDATVAGEATVYTPVFKFLSENDVATVSQHSLYKDSQAGQIVASLMAGKSVDEIATIYKATSLGDKAAIDTLATKYASTYAQILRHEGILAEVEGAVNRRVAFGFTKEDGTPIVLGSKIDESYKIIDNALTDLRSRYSTLDKALQLQSSLTYRGVSKFDTLLNKMGMKGIEDFRIDMAKQRIATKLGDESYMLSDRETALGNTIQKISTDNGHVGTIVRFVERAIDDKAHQTVPFNNSLMGNSRLRTTLRAAVDKQLVAPEQAKSIFNDFASGLMEGDKLAAMERTESAIFEGLAAKHGIPKEMADYVLSQYVYITRDNIAKAKNAVAKKQAYMLDEDGNALANAQLVSQLANGHYLPNVELLDKAFERFSKKHGKDLKLPAQSALTAKLVYDEFQSLWRNITLARVGFPINVMRDTTLRAWGDGALWYMMRHLGDDLAHSMLNSGNTVRKINDWASSITNRKNNLRYISREIDVHNKTLEEANKILKESKYDPADPKTLTPAVQTQLEYQARVQRVVDGLKQREQELLNNTKKDTIGRDPVSIFGWEFPHASAGVRGKIDYDIIRGKDDIRGLMSSSRELAMENIGRSRTGGDVLKPTATNDKVYFKSWESVLNNSLVNDPIAVKIMSHMSKEDIIKWIKSPESGDYIQRFGYDADLKRNLRYKDADAIYNRVLNTVNQFAPNSKLWTPLLEGKLDVKELKRLYPDWTERPEIISDMAENLLGQSNVARSMANGIKDMVTWLATVPTSRLMYNHYFAAKYEHKLQSMVALANEQGIIPTAALKKSYENTARAYAMDELKSKINAFNRDMNYPGIINHFLAFFPALVEQFRAYGKITMEHPEFPLRALQMSPTAMSNIPGYIGEVQKDQNGNEYIEVTLPVLGLKARLSTSWFNPINPTGGHILSASPAGGALINKLAKEGVLTEGMADAMLPFGTQANEIGYLEPTTVRRTVQMFQAWALKNGDQFNKDVNMFMDMGIQDYISQNHASPSDLRGIYKDSQKKAIALARIRFFGSLTLPLQPQYTSPLQHYADILSDYQKQYGAGGAERFTLDYPEYYILTDKLTSNTSGVNPDKTSQYLAKTHGDVVEEILGQSQNFNLKNLGAIFNGPDYEFSSSARAWLQTHTIPGTSKKFQEQRDALDTATSTIVNDGWAKWRRMNTILESTLANNNPPLSPSKGYGKAIADDYKQRFMAAMETENPLWYKVKKDASFSNNETQLVDAISIAANNDKMWADLSKQPRWHSIVDYMNFRYEIHDKLKQMGTTIDSNKAAMLREQVGDFVDSLKKKDIQFGEFYDRYFDGDQFRYVYEGKK